MAPLITERKPQNLQDIIKNGPFPIRFPSADELEQDEEWCEVQIDGTWKKIRFHDYQDVFKIPGLYETIFYRTLKCNSPNRMSNLLNVVLEEHCITPENLRVLDFGAGNGMVGEALQGLGVRKIVGIDILKEAKEAALRDRAWVYDEYMACDFMNLSEGEKRFFREYQFNCLMTVAALGFGDIPPNAFFNAFNLIKDDGLIAFNIRDEFLRLGKRSGFSKLIYSMLQEQIMEMELYKRYQHRLNINGEPIYYVAIIARKHRDIPKDFYGLE